MNTPNDVLGKGRRQLQELARSYRQSQILLTCVQLGIFDALSGHSASAFEMAALVGADARGVELLLNAATALGWLEKRDSRFSNSALAEAHLTSAGMGRSLRLESAFYRRWGNLLEAVQTGKRPAENRQDEQPADWVRTFIYALYDASRPLAPAVAEALALPEDRPLRVLDVGGGHGGYSIALATKYPQLSATVFELPRVVPVARGICRSGLARLSPSLENPALEQGRPSRKRCNRSGALA